MCLNYVIRNTQPKPRTLRPFLRRKKRLQNFVFDLIRNPRPVVFDVDGDGVFFAIGADGEFGLVILQPSKGLKPLEGFHPHCIKPIIHNIQHHT